MKEQKKVFKWYLILSIIYSSIGIILGILGTLGITFIPDSLVKNALLWVVVVLIWLTLILDIVMLIIFLVKKIERIALWLPGLDILSRIFSTITWLTTGTMGVSRVPEFAQTTQSTIEVILGLTFLVIALIIAIKLLVRK